MGSPLPKEYTAPGSLGGLGFVGYTAPRTEAESLKSQGCNTEGTREEWDGFATSQGTYRPREFGGFVFCGLHGSQNGSGISEIKGL